MINSFYIKMNKGNIYNNFTKVTEYWDPHIIAELNGHQVKIAKVDGEFTWHSHEHEDEMFYVVKGTLDIHFREKTESLSEGDYLVIPRGIEHKPVAKNEAWIMLFEPASTVNTGNEIDNFTKKNLKRI